MSTPTESSQLLQLSPRRKCSRCCSSPVHYRLPRIKEKGAIVVIVCNVLILSTLCAQLFWMTSIKDNFNIAPTLISLIVFPIAGIVADTCVGRFKVIQASVALLFTSSLLNVLLAMLQDNICFTPKK